LGDLFADLVYRKPSIASNCLFFNQFLSAFGSRTVFGKIGKSNTSKLMDNLVPAWKPRLAELKTLAVALSHSMRFAYFY